MTPEQIELVLKSLPDSEKANILSMMQELEQRKRNVICQNDFLAFIAAMDGTYKFGSHLKKLGSLLMDVEANIKNRIAVSMAPRFGKSQMISIMYPAWYLGKHPDHKVIVASHTVDLAVVMSRKVRNLMQTAEYKEVFPNTRIAPDAKAAGQWNTTAGGEFFAIGVGGALAGRGAHLIVADDPLSEQDIKAGNTTSLDAVYEWFSAGLRTRLMPDGKICVLHCLTGDTRVTLANGADKRIKNVRPGDMVASYDNGVIRPARVLGWSNQGLDRIYAVALQSGVIIRGNERHPLLVNQNGVEQWIKIKDLKAGMPLVCVTNPAVLSHCTPEASANTTTTRRVEKPQKALHLPDGASGEGRLAALMAAIQRCLPKVSAFRAVIKLSTLSAKQKGATTAPRNEVTRILSCSMGSLGLTTIGCLSNSPGSAQYAGSLHTMETPLARGKFGGWLLTTAIQLAKSAHSYVTHATSLLKNETHPNCSKQLLITLSITLDEIVSISPDGEEDVFDIQVEGTENFLANGVVSHNTRWHQRDLIGRLIKDSEMNEGGDKYETFEFPAILNEGTENEKSLWPEQWTLESLVQTRASMHHIMWQWFAQYQQNPTASEAAIIKREWIQWWPHEDPPRVDFVVQAWDTALTTKQRSDFSVGQTWGVWTTEDGDTNVILLNRVKGKFEFPELKKIAHDQFEEWQPDSVIVEAKASGQPLIDEMRRSGIFVQDYSPGKGQDKIARLNAVADMFASGHVWFPETSWASSVVEEILAFPAGEHDDEVDTCTLALMRIRKGGLLTQRNDVQNQDDFMPRKSGGYY